MDKPLAFITIWLYSMKVTFYQTSSSRSPVLEYLQKLPKPDRARVFEALQQIQNFGLDAVRVGFRQIQGKLWELKIGAHRIFYLLFEKNEMVLLHSYRKQSQKLPLNERKIAQARMKEVLK
jgi:phage-related protein